MKKTTGKVLSLVLSLALVLTSFPAMFASASSKHTVAGNLDGTDNDKIYLVNGGADDTARTVTDLQTYIGGSDITVETKDHQHKENAKIAAISHKSGDRLVKWYDSSSEAGKQDSIDDDTTSVDIQLRSQTVEGHEVLSILYKATYTDDDDNDITIKASKDFDVYVYDNGETVIGKADETTTAGDIADGKDTVELDDDFAEKKVSHEIDASEPADSMNLTVWEATAGTKAPLVTWVPVKTAADGMDQAGNKNAASPAFYTLKSSNSNLNLVGGSTQTAGGSTQTAGGTPVGVDDTTFIKPSISYTDNGYTVGKLLSDEYKGEITYIYTTDGSNNPAIVATTGKPGTGSYKATGLTITGATFTASKAVKVQGFANAGTSTDPNWIAVTAVATLTPETGKAVTTAAVVGAPGLATAAASALAEMTITAPLDVDYYVVAGKDVTAPASTSAWGSKTSVGTEQTFTAAEINAETFEVYAVAVESGTSAPSDTINAVSITDGTITVTADSKPYVTATVKKASSGSITFTAEATDWLKDNTSATPADTSVELANTKNVKVKSAIDKKIIVDDKNFKNLVKYSGSTYVSTQTSLDKNSISATNSVKVNNLEVNFDNSRQNVTVSDKASVSKISGTVDELTVSDDSKVGSVSFDDADKVIVSDAKVGDIDFDDDGTRILEVNSTKASVGNVTDALKITVKSGKTGDLTADDEIDIYADDDESATTVGDIKSKIINIDSEDSKVSVGTVTAKDADAEFTLKGSNLTVDGFDFDNYNASLKFDDFQGKIAAPENATQDGANITTTNADDKVEVTGDCDVDGVTVEDDSIITFDGKLNVSDIDGDGTLAIAAGKMYIDSDVSGTILKLTDATIAKGTTAFTSLSDTVDEDDFDCYGFTLAKTEGSKTDTFKVDSIVFKGLSVNKASSEIAKGYSETFTAYAYPGGTTMPSGYTVKWSIDADDSIFELTTNDNGTATVKVIGYDTDFASNDKATLTATLVDPDGEECDTDDYAVGECALTALQVPKVTCISDTNANFSLAQGASYQFKITSSDGAEPTFGVGSGSLAVSKVGKSGNDYFYKVTAVGKVGDQVGVYLNKTRLLVVTISAPSIQLDTGATLKVAQGKTYQFKATSTTTVNPTVGNGAVFQVVKTNKAGNNTFFTVKAVGTKGQSTGIYVNGVRRTVATVA